MSGDLAATLIGGSVLWRHGGEPLRQILGSLGLSPRFFGPPPLFDKADRLFTSMGAQPRRFLFDLAQSLLLKDAPCVVARLVHRDFALGGRALCGRLL